VCVEGYDHHCAWTSKCVGRKNLALFNTFLALLVVTLVYDFCAALLFFAQRWGYQFYPDDDGGGGRGGEVWH